MNLTKTEESKMYLIEKKTRQIAEIEKEFETLINNYEFKF